MNKRVKIFLLNLLEIDNLQIIIGLSVLLLAIHYFDVSYLDLFDFTLISSILALYIIKLISNITSKSLRRDIEEEIKLDYDTFKIIKRYPLTDNFVQWTNPDNSSVTFPITATRLFDPDINLSLVDDPEKYYQKPDFIKQHHDYLLNAHMESSVYNQVNIRLDDIIYNNQTKELTLKSSRTTYYDSLATNRCLDYKVSKGVSAREILNPGPWLHTLKESNFSNHIGFNLFFITSDHKIVLIRRNSKVSVAKNKVGSGVSASLKTKFALDENGVFTSDTFKRAILKEIKDELKVAVQHDKFSLKKSMIAFYQDAVEGGKPQFLFIHESRDVSSSDIKTSFTKSKKKYRNIYDDLLVDGSKLIFIPLEQLPQLTINLEDICLEKKKYKARPNFTATMVLLSEYMRCRDENN